MTGKHAAPGWAADVLLIAAAGGAGSLMALSWVRRDMAGLTAAALLGALILKLCWGTRTRT